MRIFQKLVEPDLTLFAAATAGLAVANEVLNKVRAVLSSAEYISSKAASEAAKAALDVAQKTADTTLAAAKHSLDLATAAANVSIMAAQGALDAAKKSSMELHIWNIAKDALSAFEATEAALLSAGDALLQDLMKSVEKIAFDAASAALAIAKSATKELDAAKAILSAVEGAIDEFAAFGQWLNKRLGNIFNVEKVELNGSLNDAANKKPFLAHIVGTFADYHIDEEVEFTPGQAEDFVKNLVMKYVNEAKADIKKFIK